MLTKEEAENRIKAAEIADGREKRIAALKKLPPMLAAMGLAICGLGPDGTSPEWNDHARTLQPQWDRFDQVEDSDRRTLFEIIYGRMAGSVAGVLEALKSGPYQSHWSRKPFRAPGDLEATRLRRIDVACAWALFTEAKDQPLEWYAAYAPYMWRNGIIGTTCAASIDAGGKHGAEIKDLLLASATNEHEIGAMGAHVCTGLLGCADPAAWEFMEKLLLAAQRQEGLRTAILETVDESHPVAFRRMLRVILENDLHRFSAVTRALDVWLGYLLDSQSQGTVKKILERVLLYLEDPAARASAIKNEEPWAAYEALWATAFSDANAAITRATPLLAEKSVERRYVGAKLLDEVDLASAHAALWSAIEDADMRIFALAGKSATEHAAHLPKGADGFAAVAARLGSLPKERATLPALVWPWAECKFGREDALRWLARMDLDGRPASAYAPYLKEFDSYDRQRIVEKMVEAKTWDDAIHDALLDVLPYAGAGDVAAEEMAKRPVRPKDAIALEALLSRKGEALRRRIFAVLASQNDAEAIAGAKRLIAAKSREERLGGLELLRQLKSANREVAACAALAKTYRAERKSFPSEEENQLAAIEGGQGAEEATDASFFNPNALSKPLVPQTRKGKPALERLAKIIKSLDAFVANHKEAEFETTSGEKQLLGSEPCDFPSPEWEEPIESQLERLPLQDLFLPWYRANWPAEPETSLDQFWLRTLTCSGHPLDPHERSWSDDSDDKTYLAWAERHFGKPPKLKHPRIVGDLALWFTRLAGWPLSAFPADALLDYFENSLADSPLIGPTPKPARKKKDEFEESEDWREHSWATEWLTEAWRGFETCMSAAQRRRAWGLLCWFDRPGNGWPRRRPEKSQLLEAHESGIATDEDVLDHLIGPRTEIPGYYGSEVHGLLRDLTDTPSTGRWDRGKTRLAHPRAAALADGVCARILGIELARGENPTSVTPAVLSVCGWPGLETLVKLHRALGTAANARVRGWKKADGRVETFSQMIDRSIPAPEDTPEKFAAAMKEFGEAKILQQAFDTPAWIEHVVFALGWPGLKEAIYWFLAHTRQSNRPTEEGAWDRVLSERTPLTESEIREGAVDIEWFHRTCKAVGPKRWASLVEASKYGADGQGHKAALQLADALLGKTKTADLIAKIRKANSREAVRLLGLVPLPAGAKRAKELKSRYAALQDYLRYAKKLSAMTKEGALRTAEIGFANLARTAGYADPIRFGWAMERESVADLEQGPVSAKAGAVTVTLAIDDEGTPTLSASKDGNPLKAIPADAKKHAKVAPLVERLADLKKQKPRCKEALERMMVRGDSLKGEEVRDLFTHPILAPLLARLVLLGKDLAGYPVKGGAALLGHDGEALALKKTDSVRIAHPCDLYAAKSWAAYQKDCFAREVIQPFKQVFRELYVPTKTELDEKQRSRRYAGQQVNPTQAKALFGARGWTVDAYESVSKTSHDDMIAVDVGFLYGGGTSVDVEGWTIETVTFRKLREHEPIAPGAVSSRLFSEVMRDLDLVVSVAHRGGVDPEATASTVEMRTALLRETCGLFKLKNVKLKGSHATIAGKLAEYSVHLGSGVVHRLPGGSVCIVPVHAQHRGRLFLPFADDDPKTAEITSKVLLLAKDHEIQDPSILQQLLA